MSNSHIYNRKTTVMKKQYNGIKESTLLYRHYSTITFYNYITLLSCL